MFSKIIKMYIELVVKFRWLVLILTLLITAFFITQLNTLKLDNNPDLWAPQSHEFIKTTHLLEDTFGGRNFTLIGVIPKQGDIFTPAILSKIKNIQTDVENLPEAVKNNIVSLAAKRIKDIQGDSQGMVVKEILETIPQTPEDIERVRQAVKRNPIYNNVLISPDGSAAAIAADFRMQGQNTAYAPLYEKLRAIADKQQDDTVDILLGGQPVEAANFEFSMQKMPIYFGIAFLIIMTVQYLAFRTLQGVLLPMVTAILAVLWALGILAIANIHMDALNTTTPILIMAIATGHAVQILKRYYEELDTALHERDQLGNPNHITTMKQLNHLAIIRSITQVGPVMLTAGTIAALAFFSMVFSDMAMLRHFGILAGAGVVSIIFIEFTFIPSIRAIVPCRVPRHHGPDFLDKLLDKLGDLLVRPKTSSRIMIISIMIIGLVSVGAFHLKADNSVKQYNAPDSQICKDSSLLNHKFGGTDSIIFLVEGNDTDSMKDPKVLAAMDKLQKFLEQQPYVGKTQSLSDLIRRMNMAMHEDNPTFDTIPTDRNLISQYLLLYSISGQPQDFDNMVDNDYQRAVIWTYLKTDSTSYAQQLWKQANELINREFPNTVNVRIGGVLPQTVAVNESLVDTKVKSMAQMMLVVFLLSSLALRSFVGGLLVVTPLMAITLANFGLMGWLGIPLDMGTATTTAMVTGIGADYEIYMLYRLREEFKRQGNLNGALRTSLMTSGKAIIFVALSIAGGYAALLFSDFQFYPRLGMTMMATMIISALLSILLLRAVITVFRPKFIER